MDSSGGYTRNTPFQVILTPPLGDGNLSVFSSNYQAPIILNPDMQWEAAILDAYIPTSLTVKYNTRKKYHWFMYIYKYDIPQHPLRNNIYISYPRWYYEPEDGETTVHSFIKKFNKVQNRKELYGEFTNQNPPAKLQIYVEDDYLCITVVKAMDFENEMIIIKMDKEEYTHCFGKIAQCDTYYKGWLLPVKDGEKSLCIFDETDSEIKIKSLLQNPSITETGFDPTDKSLLGVIVKSTEKIMRTTRMKRGAPKFLTLSAVLVKLQDLVV